MMLYSEKRRATKAAVIEHAGGENATKQDILDTLFPEHGDGYFYVYWWDNPWQTKKKFYHRLNLLWITPLFLIFVAPFQWLTKGRIGFDERSKVGEIILNLVGEND